MYYTPTGNPVAQTRGTSPSIRAEFELIAAAFTSASGDIIAKGTITGQVWSGIHDFTAGTVKVATPVGVTDAVTKQYADGLSFAAALPAQTGAADKLVTTNGGTASWTQDLKSSLRWVDSTDTTKKVVFALAGLTTGSTRTITVPDRDVTLGGFSNLLVISTTQTWMPPAGVTRAKLVVQDGGYSSGSNSGSPASAGRGGNASISYITVNPTVTYTATIGAGGVNANGGGSNSSPVAGGASSFNGLGLVTKTSAVGDILIPGGTPPVSDVAGGLNSYLGGSSLFSGSPSGAPQSYGAGAAGPGAGAAAVNGYAGVITIEY